MAQVAHDIPLQLGIALSLMIDDDAISFEDVSCWSTDFPSDGLPAELQENLPHLEMLF